jgi:hypothetical protein
VLPVFLLLCLGTPGGPFSSGAHGNGDHGAARDPLAAPTGHCAQCHERKKDFQPFAPGYVSQGEGVCLACHTGAGSLQAGGLVNRSYSFRAGGYADTLDSVQAAFAVVAPGSAHNLGDIQSLLANRWGFGPQPNPCTACHNPHSAQGDPANAPNARKTADARGWPTAPPNRAAGGGTQAWGAAPEERMATYAQALGGHYQAPLAATGFEPDGSNVQDGTNLADLTTLCTTCHDATTSIPSTALGRALHPIDWATELHGGGVATYCARTVASVASSLLLPPYDGLTQCGTYVLSCTDCHEPHGSPNNFLVRKQVNSGPVTVVNGGLDVFPSLPDPRSRSNLEWISLCGKCHANLGIGGNHVHPTVILGEASCSFSHCHQMNHGTGLSTYRNCGECHFHGNREIDGVATGKPLF